MFSFKLTSSRIKSMREEKRSLINPRSDSIKRIICILMDWGNFSIDLWGQPIMCSMVHIQSMRQNFLGLWIPGLMLRRFFTLWMYIIIKAALAGALLNFFSWHHWPWKRQIICVSFSFYVWMYRIQLSTPTHEVFHQKTPWTVTTSLHKFNTTWNKKEATHWFHHQLHIPNLLVYLNFSQSRFSISKHSFNTSFHLRKPPL